MAFDLDGKTVLVTGGSGSIGSALVKGLLAHKVAKVIVFSRDETKQFVMKKRIADSRLETVVGDIRNYRTIEKAIVSFKPELVYHAAAMKHLTMCELFPLEAVRTNAVGTQNIVDLARRYAVPRLVNISTDKAVYPTSVLGSTKLIAERTTANAGYTSVRFGNVTGSRGSVIPVLIDEMFRHKRLTITDSRVTRFLMTIEDAVGLILKATGMAAGEDVFILKMKAFKLSDLVEVLAHEVGPHAGFDPDRIEVKETGLLNGEKLHEELATYEELAHASELADMYVLTKDRKRSLSAGRQSATFKDRSSENADRLSRRDLSQLVRSVLESMKHPALDIDR
jgi:UDP-N-acetylglucosamine 4,6-dehydratase